MKPPPFLWFAPSTLDEAVALLAEHGEDAKVLAGGHSLIPLMKLRLAAPSVLRSEERRVGKECRL